MTIHDRQPHRLWLRAIVGLLLVLAGWIALPAVTLAHAQQVRSSPTPGAILSTPPSQVDVWFSEHVTAGVSTIQVYDARHHRVDTGTTAVDPSDTHHMSVRLSPLSSGLYTIVWSNISADDGHPNKGGFAFTMSAPATSSAPVTVPAGPAAPGSVTTSNDVLAQAIDLIAGWLTFLAFVLAGGGAAFALALLLPTLGRIGPVGAALGARLNRRFAWIALVSAAMGAIAAFVSLLAKAEIATSLPVVGILSGGVLGDMLAPWSGHVWIVREVAFVAMVGVALAGVLFSRRADDEGSSGGVRIVLTALAILGAAGLVFQSLDSHLAAGHVARHGPLGSVALALHLLAVGLWVGGLGYAALILWPAWRRLDAALRQAITANAIARFSKLALASVIVIALTGSYVAILMVPSLGDLLSSTYGQALDLKILLFIALIIIGALNRRMLAELAAAAPGAVLQIASQAGQRLVRAMRREFVIAGVILLAAATMLEVGPPNLALRFGATTLNTTVTLQPAQSSSTPAPSTYPASTTYTTQAKAGDLSVKLNVDPAVAGAANAFTVTVSDANGRPVSGAEVKLWLTAKSVDMGTQVLKADPQGPGSYRVQSPALAAPGDWQAQVVIRRDNFPEAQTTFAVPAAAPSLANASAASLQAELTLNPNPPVDGKFTTVTLHLTDPAGKPVDGAQISAIWTMPQMGHELHTTFQAVTANPGTYQTHVNFIMAGGWIGDLSLNLPDGRTGQPHYALNVEPLAKASSGESPLLALLNGRTLVALVALAGAIGVIVISRKSTERRSERILEAVIVLVLLALGLGLGWISVTDAYRQSAINPVPATTESIARGSWIYQQQCMVCHGSDARGDGPMAQTLNPRPADLTVHINQHPDGDLYNWVTNGIPGSAMPAFKDQLSDEERWDVLNYLHSLAPKKK
jgi:copper transport protein